MLTAETGRVMTAYCQALETVSDHYSVTFSARMGQDVGQAHVLLSDTLRTDRSARPYWVLVSMW